MFSHKGELEGRTLSEISRSKLNTTKKEIFSYNIAAFKRTLDTKSVPLHEFLVH